MIFFTFVGKGKENSLVTVRAPEFAILGQTVHLHCNFTLPPGNVNFYSLKWIHNGQEVYRLVPAASRELQRMVFSTGSLKIDIESSKMIGAQEHLLVLQTVNQEQSGEYR